MAGYIWPPSIPGKHENDSPISQGQRQRPLLTAREAGRPQAPGHPLVPPGPAESFC